MFNDLKNIYMPDNLEVRYHSFELAKKRTEIYTYDKSILDYHVSDFKNFDFFR